MDWDAIGAISETIGTIAVIATLLYLGRQISQTNQVAKASGARELQQKYAEFYTLIATNPEIKGLVTRLRAADYKVQSEEEEEQIESFVLLLLGIWQTTAIAFEQGQIDLNMYRIYCDDVEVKLSKWPGLRSHVKRVLNNYPDAEAYEIFKNLFREPV